MSSDRARRAAPARSADASDAARPPALAGPGAELLALQRRIGNAATGRWLARQAAEAGTRGAAWTDVCATPVAAGAGSAPVAIAADEPLIHSVIGPCLTHPAGGYHWWVRYQLPHPAPARGHIIQELYQEGSGGSHEHFWEYWQVAAGEREPADRTATPSWVTPSGLPYDDRYTHGVVGDSGHAPNGWYRHRGVVRFYPGPLPSQFSGGRNQTWERPDGWAGGGMRHDCYAEWDRRPGRRPKLGLVAFAGTQEYRAGDAVTPRW